MLAAQALAAPPDVVRRRYTLLFGDCLDRMRDIPAGSVGMVLADLPYGTTACKWDVVIPFAPLWAAYRRVCKRNAAIVLTASQPFTSALVMSNLKCFRYSLVWDKVNRYTGALNANRMPLRRHEDIAVFYRFAPVYNKQFRSGKAFRVYGVGHGDHTAFGKAGPAREVSNDGRRHNPCPVIAIKGNVAAEQGMHPTQKPVALMEYLIKTYTNPGELVLDNSMGSGTTGVAALGTGRNFIGIELAAAHFETAVTRLWGTLPL